MPYKSRAQKEADRLAHAHWNAQWCARFAEEAREAGDTRRAMRNDETALKYEIAALNKCLRDEPCDTKVVRPMFVNVIFYAQLCGRHRKAEHLRAAASRWEKAQENEAETRTPD